MIAIPTVDRENERDAIDLVRAWAARGVRRVQIYEPRAATTFGRASDFVEHLLRETSVQFQVVAAADSIDSIQSLGDSGAWRVAVGSRAIEEPEWLASAASTFPGLLVPVVPLRERRIEEQGRRHVI